MARQKQIPQPSKAAKKEKKKEIDHVRTKEAASSKIAVKVKRKPRARKLVAHMMKKLQKGSDFMIPRAPFRRLVIEISWGFIDNIRFGKNALNLIQSLAENFLQQRFTKANHLALHARRVTVMPKDTALVPILAESKHTSCMMEMPHLYTPSLLKNGLTTEKKRKKKKTKKAGGKNVVRLGKAEKGQDAAAAPVVSASAST